MAAVAVLAPRVSLVSSVACSPVLSASCLSSPPVVFLLSSLSPVTISRVCSASRQHFPSSFPEVELQVSGLVFFRQRTRVSAVVRLARKKHAAHR